MREGPLESDWKKSRAILVPLRERYLEKVNQELEAILHNEKMTPTERFWEVEERTRETAKILDLCLNWNARSKMFEQMLYMYRYGMLTDDDLRDFSEELQERVRRVAEI